MTIFVGKRTLMKRIILTLSIFSLLFIACSETPQFVGEWQLEKMDMGGSDQIFANVLGNPTYVFNADKTYEIITGTQTENGTWALKDKIITLYSKELDKTSKLSIWVLNKDNFVWQIGENPSTKVYLKK